MGGNGFVGFGAGLGLRSNPVRIAATEKKADAENAGNGKMPVVKKMFSHLRLVLFYEINMSSACSIRANMLK